MTRPGGRTVPVRNYRMIRWVDWICTTCNIDWHATSGICHDDRCSGLLSLGSAEPARFGLVLTDGFRFIDAADVSAVTIRSHRDRLTAFLATA